MNPNIPPSNLFKKKPTQGSQILQNAMQQHMMKHPNMPTQIQKPKYKPIPPGAKIPQQYFQMMKQQQSSNKKMLNQQDFSYPMPSNSSQQYSNSYNNIKMSQTPKMMSSTNNVSDSRSQAWSNSGSIQSGKVLPRNIVNPGNSMRQPQEVYHQNPYYKPQQHQLQSNKSVKSTPNYPIEASNQSTNYQTHQLSQKPPSNAANQSMKSGTPKFHPMYFLVSSFPILTPNDQIYLPVINRLENAQTKKCFNELYVNLKFLVIQPDEEFWKYMSHLHSISFNGLSDKEVAEGNKLRLALESCLTTFCVKQFNKCVNSNEVSCSSVAVSKKIYEYQSVFNSKAFELYQKLVDTVFEFYERVLKSKDPEHINIIVSSWYIDTIKALEITMIYGNKQPQKVKQLIKSMYGLSQSVFTQDFVNYFKALHKYIQTSSGINKGDEQISLLESLTKKIDARSSKYMQTKSTFGNFQKYCIREIFYVCSEALKLFMMITNVFKFFPSHVKLILMDNGDFLRTLIKISVRVIYNLREQDIEKNRRWKIPKKVKISLKNMEFILMDKITQMFKFMFLVTKNALDQEVDEDCTDQPKGKQDLRHRKIKIKFYKRLIEGTVNRRKDKQKDNNEKKKEKSEVKPKIQENIKKPQAKNSKLMNKNTIEKQSLYNQVQFLSEDSPDQQIIEEAKQKKQSQQEVKLQSNSEKQSQNKEENKKQYKKQKYSKRVIPQNQYGRVLLKYLLRKQLKKDAKKYEQNPYFYTKKLYNHCKQQYEAYKLQQQQNSSSDSIQHTSSFESLYIYLKVLDDFQIQVKRQYNQEIKFNQKYHKTDLIIRQIPTLTEFKRREERMKLQELMKELNKKNKEYEDEPNEEEEIEIYWDNKLEDEDFTNVEEYFDQTKESISFNQQSESSKVKANQSQELSPEEITELQDNVINVPSITSINSSIFKPHESLQKVTNSMIKEEIQTFEKFKHLNWHEISRVSFLKQEKQGKKGQSEKDNSLMQYNDLIKVADIGLSFDMELALDDEDDSSHNISKLSHFYYMDKKKKSFMQDYSWEEKQSVDVQQESESGDYEDYMEEREFDDRKNGESKFKKAPKIKYKPKNAEQIVSVKKTQPSQKQQNTPDGCFVRRDYANYMSANQLVNYPMSQQYAPQKPMHQMSPMPPHHIQQMYQQMPQMPPHMPQNMAHMQQMIPPVQATMYGQMPMNYPLNYGHMPPQMPPQMPPMYTPVLPANISALNLSHQQNSMNMSQFINSNGSFQYNKFAPGPGNNVLNRSGGSNR